MDDLELMEHALTEARKALDHGDAPVGALVVVDGAIVASAHNECVLHDDPTARAEVLAIRAAAAAVGSSQLEGATLVSTLEPCPLSAGAALMARVGRVVFGAEDMTTGATGSLYNLGADPRLNHEFEVKARVRQDECTTLLAGFIAERPERP